MLTDVPGLGKTGQAIVAAERVRLGAQVWVIVPKSLLRNWQREIKAWVPSAGVCLVTSGKTSRHIDADYVVTTHGLMRSKNVRLLLHDARPRVVIVDEAHVFRTPTAKHTQALFGLGKTPHPVVHPGVDYVWLLTGTPMPNDPSNLWAPLGGLDRECLRDELGKPLSYRRWIERYCRVVDTPFGRGWKVVGAREEHLPELRQRVRRVMFGRTKKALTLPPIRWGVVTLTADAEDLAAVLQVEPSGELGLDDLRGEEFATWRRLSGEVKARAASELLCEELLADSTKQLGVFAHHLSVLDILEERLTAAGVAVERIDGSYTAAARQAAVDAFQAGRARVMLCQISAGGVGITLTRGHDAVFVEQSFTPGDNQQAADRFHRIGQTSSVLVRVFALGGSVDEVVQERLAVKTQMIRQVFNESSAKS